MLKEYLLIQRSDASRWSNSMPGVQICRFSLPETDQELQSIPVCGAPLHFEVFFCLSGRLMVQPLQGTSCTVQAPGIFLLSDSSPLRWCRYRGNLGGILIAVDARAARESLAAVCSSLGIKLDTRSVKRKIAAKKGCMALSDTPWTQAFWEALPHLTGHEQERYCVFKSVELLYLLCAGMSESEGFPFGAASPASYNPLEVGAYIRAHLSEKLTIMRLCQHFSVSSTLLKEDFRRAYGVPVHRFLIQQRLQRARELIRTTRMPIQQIAQSVGYEGMSQFSAAFKQAYGTTPGRYRKMSETAIRRPF